MKNWGTEQSADLYGINRWGEGFFSVNKEGNIQVSTEAGKSVDLLKLTTEIVARGIELPVLIRFDDILVKRVKQIYAAFQAAIDESKYQGKYSLAYPIKVNQQRHVVDTVRAAGRDFGLGLEVGSKPEMVAILAIHDTQGAVLLCNGYKDPEYIELALHSSKIGRRPIIIVEQLHELDIILKCSSKLGIEAEIGVRMKPLAKGSGKWEASSGTQAKFGLSTPEILVVIEKLKAENKLHWLKLLHFHVGSQITSMVAIKRVMREATRTYTEIYKLCPSLSILDVGGGLAVDYDGSRTNFESSMNYTLEEYARDIIDAIQVACEEEGIPHPNLISESGRALVAHHSVLVGQVIDSAKTADIVNDLGNPPSDHETLSQLRELYDGLNVKNCQETLNDALSLREEIWSKFIQGDMNLIERAYADAGIGSLIAKIAFVAKDLKYIPEDVALIDEKLRDIYTCNFSLFQSLPDSWAIDQLFPVMPIHRLVEKPTRRGIIADISCDSDGKIDRFVDLKDVKKYLDLHTFDSKHPYYFGIFLTGAYQEILGDLHNLFGDTNAVHVSITGKSTYDITHIVEGDTIREVLSYVQYDTENLIDRMRVAIEKALDNQQITAQDSAQIMRKFRNALEEYTYLKY